MTTYSFPAVAADHTIAASFALGRQAALELTFGRSVVTYGGSTLLGGRLYDAATGSGLGGRSVILERATSVNGQWSIVGTFTTSSDPGSLGRFFTPPVSPTEPTYFHLKYVATQPSEYGSAQGADRKLGVRPILGRPAVPSSIRARRYFTVSGSLTPRSRRARRRSRSRCTATGTAGTSS